MARFRHLRANTEDWAQTVGGEGLNVFKKPLENGHNLHVWHFDNNLDHNRGWSWAITDPSLAPPSDSHHPRSSSWLAAGGDTAHHHNQWSQDMPEGAQVVHDQKIPNREEAQRQVEEHYQKMFPIGTSTGGHDSGVDYDLNRIMREQGF